MRTFRYLKSILLCSLAILSLVSCKDDDEGGSVVINSIWSNTYESESRQLTSAYTGSWVRIEGSGFDGLQAVYFNGQAASITPTLFTSKYITVAIPSGAPLASDLDDESLINTVRVVTNHGEAVYKDFVLKDKNKQPNFSSVSYTMPVPGQNITLEGKYLSGITEVRFPDGGDGALADVVSLNDSVLVVKTPEGVGDVSGAIWAVCNGDTIFTKNDMFFKEGIFLHTFKENLMVSGGSANIKIYDDPSEIKALTGLEYNPDVILGIPEAKKTVPVASNSDEKAGYFKFYPIKAIEQVLTQAPTIKRSNSMKNLAFQFDLYIPGSWNSGVVALRINKNQKGADSKVIYNYDPWTVEEPMVFDGWRTVTISLDMFPSLALGDLDSYLTFLNNEMSHGEGLIGFFNYDENGDGHTPSKLENFQMYIANMRFVDVTQRELAEQ